MVFDYVVFMANRDSVLIIVFEIDCLSNTGHCRHNAGGNLFWISSLDGLSTEFVYFHRQGKEITAKLCRNINIKEL